MSFSSLFSICNFLQASERILIFGNVSKSSSFARDENVSSAFCVSVVYISKSISFGGWFVFSVSRVKSL